MWRFKGGKTSSLHYWVRRGQPEPSDGTGNYQWIRFTGFWTGGPGFEVFSFCPTPYRGCPILCGAKGGMSYVIPITLAHYIDRSCPLGEMGRRNIINEQCWPRHPFHPPFAPSAKRKSALSTKDGAPSSS